MMLQHAEERGANAVIGSRYDATEVMGGVERSPLLWHGGYRCANGLTKHYTSDMAVRLDKWLQVARV